MTAMTLPELVAGLPAVLGFYPTESVVLVMLTANDVGAHTLGPVLRADVDDHETLQDATATVACLEHDLLLAFLITEQPGLVDLDALTDAGAAAIWHADAIDEDAPLTLLHHAPDVLPAPLPDAASVPPVHASPATRALLARGGIIRETRQRLTSSYTYAPGLVPARCRELATAWQHHTGEDILTDVDLVTVLDTIASHLADAPDAVTFDRSLRENAELLGMTACCLGTEHRARARDLLLGVALDHPRAAAVLLALVARTHPDAPRRANALAILAVLDIAGPGTDHTVLLQLARKTDPDNVLARYLTEATAMGVQRDMLDAIKQGAAQAHHRLDLSES